MSLCDVNAYKRWIQIDEGDTSKDTYFQELIDRAESKLKLYANTPIYAEILDSKKVLIPKYLPVTNVLSLKLDDELLVENEDYYVYRYYIYLENAYKARKNISLDYEGGYLDTDEDFLEMIHAVCLTVAYWNDLTRQVAPDTMIDYRIPREVEKILHWRSRL